MIDPIKLEVTFGPITINVIHHRPPPRADRLILFIGKPEEQPDEPKTPGAVPPPGK